MTSLDVRSNSAVMKRAEQLKRWEESDTNREPPTPRPERGRKIKFSSGCVFLAACMSADKDEVIKLLETGADINTANVDGLTALHQACIDDNLEMVEFLVEHGADINKQDNEGWTPLHATASCGFVSIARYLVEHGADPAAVNSDGDLAVDLAVDIQHLPMMDFMQKVVAEHNIDCEKARQAEEQLMLNDAKKWLRSDASEVDRPHPKTGATALHVAAAKGYTKVISLLLAGRANVDKQDNDGWTPLHAASHWGQKESAEMLVNAMADMDIRNYAGQTCVDVADRKMAKFLEELRSSSNKRSKRRPSSQIRISDTIENNIDNTPTKIIRVEVKPDQAKDQANDDKSKIVGDTIKPPAEASNNDEEAPWRRNSLARMRTQNESPTKNQVPDKEVSKINSTETSDVILRRTQSFEHDEKFYQKYNELRARIKANSCPILPATQLSNHSSSNNNSTSNTCNNNNNNNNNNNSNNSNSSNSNTNTYNINTHTNVIGKVHAPNQNYSVQRSASLKDHRTFRTISTQASTAPTSTSTTSTTNITTSTSATPTTTTPIRRSFVPPVRDEESETQRKAHAKRVRETRRSTQGVTLDEIKSAEELVKKKNSSMNNNNNSSSNDNQATTTATITLATTTTTPNTSQVEVDINFESQTPAAAQRSPSTSPTPAQRKQITSATIPTDEVTYEQLDASCNEQSKVSSTKADEVESEDDDENEDELDDETEVKAATETEAEVEATTAYNENNDDEEEDDISATFTIIAPCAMRHSSSVEKETSSDADVGVNNDDEEVSATYVLTSRNSLVSATTPTETVETTIVVVPPGITINKPDDEENDDVTEDDEEHEEERDEDEDDANNQNNVTDEHEEEQPESAKWESSSTVKADKDSEAINTIHEYEIVGENTIFVGNDNENEKTESSETDEQIKINTNIPNDEILTTEGGRGGVGEETRLRARSLNVTAFSPLKLTAQQDASVTLVNSKTSPASTPTSAITTNAAITPTLDSPVRLRDKRALFDVDVTNASTLADKLRNEANKYAESETIAPAHQSLPSTTANTGESGRSGDAASTPPPTPHYSSRRSLDSSSLHNSLLHQQRKDNDNSGNTSSATERRPSWRLKFDAGCKFKLEDASSGNTFPPSNSTIIPSAPAVIAAANLSSSISQRRLNNAANSLNSSNQSLNSIGRPVSAPVHTASSTASLNNDNNHSTVGDRNSDSNITIFGRRLTGGANTGTTAVATSSTATHTGTGSTVSTNKNNEDNDNDKENDNRSALATQGVIQRRRKPKRRSTGVVHLDMDELDPEKQDANVETEEKGSGNERTPSRSRLSSSSSTVNTSSSTATDEHKSRDKSENGEAIDYKALWEAAKLENDKLKQQLKKKDEEIVQTRATLERFTNATTKNLLSELEKRERRAMERKLSEMEEELKLLQKLKTENERLRAENRALTRVVSKLTTSAQNQLSKSK